MECRKCNYPLEPGSKFCNRCGTKVENQNNSCAYCGHQMALDDKFCEKCGRPKRREGAKAYHQRLAEGTNMAHPQGRAYPPNKSSQMEFMYQEDWEEEELEEDDRKPMLWLYILLTLIPLAMIMITLIILKPWGSSGSKQAKPEASLSQETKDIAIKGKVDHHLDENNVFEVEGRIFQNAQNRFVLQWKDKMTIVGKDDTEQLVSATDRDSAYIDEKDMETSYLHRLAKEDVLKVTGKWYFKDKELYVLPSKILNKEGTPMAEVVLKETTTKKDAKKEDKTDKEDKKEENKVKEGYILSASEERILTENDLSGLSARELNYAKNEIYARHGRKFKSKELREYFESQPWYKPTIEPEQFNDGYLSDVEKRNSEILKEAEYRLEPNGYPLDQN